MNLLERIVTPVLTRLEEMPVDQHEGAGRQESSRLEALSRCLVGIAPWLGLPSAELGEDEASVQGKVYSLSLRAQTKFFNAPHELPLQSIIDFGYLSQAYLRYPKLFGGLSTDVKYRIARDMQKVIELEPISNNWRMMTALIGTFLASIRGKDPYLPKVRENLDEVYAWYKGDGVYGDGVYLQNDYYNSLVIHPAFVDILASLPSLAYRYPHYGVRATKYAQVQERMISPQGTYPVIGRSIVYRAGVFQCLSYMVYLGAVIGVSSSAVRCALSEVIQRFDPAMFGEDDWLSIGFAGPRDLSLAETYISTGSTYAMCLVFPLLGLSPKHECWNAGPSMWTQALAWGGLSFPPYKGMDYL